MIGSPGARFTPLLAAAPDFTGKAAGNLSPTIAQGPIQTIVIDSRRSMRKSSANDGGCDQLARVFSDIAESSSLEGAPPTKGAALERQAPRAEASVSEDPGSAIDEMILISQSNLNRVGLRRKYGLKTRH